MKRIASIIASTTLASAVFVAMPLSAQAVETTDCSVYQNRMSVLSENYSVLSDQYEALSASFNQTSVALQMEKASGATLLKKVDKQAATIARLRAKLARR